jgi:hypothetical protein
MLLRGKNVLSGTTKTGEAKMLVCCIVTVGSDGGGDVETELVSVDVVGGVDVGQGKTAGVGKARVAKMRLARRERAVRAQRQEAVGDDRKASKKKTQSENRENERHSRLAGRQSVGRKHIRKGERMGPRLP